MDECFVIAIHLGGGPPCSAARLIIYKKLCKKACSSVAALLRNGGNAVDAVCEAVRIMEDDPHTNAGRGSNLTLSGEVECDASVMDGSTLNFGAVGAIPGIKNPIQVARALLHGQNSGLMSLGRVPPCLLVSNGAREWAVANGFETVTNTEMASKRALKTLEKHKLKLDKADCGKKSKVDTSNSGLEIITLDQLLDTVGAVCIDVNGNVAGAVSSGGLILKHSGRVGQAAIYAAGCWAENSDKRKAVLPSLKLCHSLSGQSDQFEQNASLKDSENDVQSVAAVTTGVGENLIKTMFARECAQSLKCSGNPQKAVEIVFQEKILKSPFLKESGERLAGVLLLKHDGRVAEVIAAHSTASMCFAFANHKSQKVSVELSTLPPGMVPGTHVQIHGRIFKM